MRRLRFGELLSAASAVALLAVMFLEWYAPATRAEGLSAWSAFTIVDLVLALVVAAGLALLAFQVVGRGPALPVGIAVITTTLSLAAALLVLYRIANQPGPNDAIDVQLGAWLGLLATVGVFIGGWRSLDDERARPSDPPPPEPERRPAPRLGPDEPVA